MIQSGISPPPCEVLILTASASAFRAVTAHLQDTEELVHPSGTIYCWGTFPGKHQLWRVASAQIEVGGTQAGIEAERALTFFQARIALFVGTAGGLKDVQLGDVVVATKIYAYESGKA